MQGGGQKEAEATESLNKFTTQTGALTITIYYYLKKRTKISTLTIFKILQVRQSTHYAPC